MFGKEVKEITNKLLALGLEKNEINYSACEDFWNEAYKVKKPLLDLFKGELIIKKKVSFQKTHEEMRRDIRESCMLDILDARFESEARTAFFFGIDNTDYKNFIRETASLDSLAKNEYSKTHKFIHPVTGKNIVVQKGSKISKAFKHFIDPDFLSNVQTEYSKILNERTLSGNLCISIHPADYLTASLNSTNWTSCFNIIDGCYKAATLNLINSPSTIIAYLESSNSLKWGRNGLEFEWNNKKWRTYLIMDEDGTFVQTTKGYPYENSQLTEAAVNMVGELVGEKFTRNESTDVIVRAANNFYNDHEEACEAQAFSTKGFDNDFRTCLTLKVAEGALCPSCGETFSNVDEFLECAYCGEYLTCEDCGDSILESDAHFAHGECFCEACYFEEDSEECYY